MSQVLVVNAGSSSLKYALVDPSSGRQYAAGIVERIGEAESIVNHDATADSGPQNFEREIPDHRAAFAEVQARLDLVAPQRPAVVGHRVVHGGDRFTAPALIDDDVVTAIEACVPLAPLHNPAALAGIAGARAEYSDVPQVAVFDTAFHTTIPASAREYALDRDLAEEHRLKRYGFHGTSHQYVSHRAASFLRADVSALNLVSLHLGNGASACAIRGGVSVETSMGVTPLEGLVMGTRCGDLDPSVPQILMRAGHTADQIDDIFNRTSGLKGVCGENDMREIHRRADAGDNTASLAREMFAHRVRKYIGAYLFTLGRADAILFTAGIGEHDAWTRERICRDLEHFGIVIDTTANGNVAGHTCLISDVDSAIKVLVVRTDEEHAIAEQSWAVVSG